MSSHGIYDIGTINPQWDDVIVVKVNVERMPPHIKVEYLKTLKDELKPLFPNNKVIILSGKIELEVKQEIDFDTESKDSPTATR